jgi:hypothetical protein
MARITTVNRDGRYRVSIRGALSVRDLRRLERACGPALEHQRPPLDIHVGHITALDDASRVFLKRLATRGASILETPGGEILPDGEGVRSSR